MIRVSAKALSLCVTVMAACPLPFNGVRAGSPQPLTTQPLAAKAGAAIAPVAEAAGKLLVAQGSGRLLRINRPIGSVIVGDQRIADVKLVAPQLVYVFGVSNGRTDLTVLNEEDGISASMQVVVAADAAVAAEDLKKTYPASGLEYDIAGNRLVLHGRGDSVEEGVAAQRMLDAMDAKGHNDATYAGSQQISLKVRFTEVSRSQVHNLGFDWSAVFGLGVGSLGLATGASVGQAVGAATRYSLSPYATLRGGLSHNSINANVVLEALESKGAVHTIAEPNLTVRSGKTAKFRAGGDIPVPVPQQQGALTIEYHSYGISLEFTPVLIGRNRIAIHVAPEVSEISAENGVTFSGASVPSFTVRRAETDVELASGQTFAIAGLFQRNVSNSRDSLPGIGSLPVLGELLGSEQYKRGESELVILITPYLVEPISPEAALAPGEQTGGALKSVANSLVERIGFIVE